MDAGHRNRPNADAPVQDARGRGITRGGFLRAAAAGAAGAAGIGMLDLGGAAARADSVGPAESGWRRLSPPLSTPWTDRVSPHDAHPEYPRPQLVRREWASLNGVWQFAGARAGEAPPIGRALPERILVPFPVESALSGIMRHEERMFYRRHFRVPSGWRIAGAGAHARRLLLHLDAVDWEATVWLNGHRLAVHRGGYDRFSVDLTDALRRRRDGTPSGEQELVIGVHDPTEDGIQPLGKQRVSAIVPPDSTGGDILYYTPSSGIWQSVWLEPVPARHLAELRIVPDPAAGRLRVTPQLAGGRAPVRVRVLAGGRVLAESDAEGGSELSLHLPHPRLWSPEDPFLYDLEIEVGHGPDPDRVRSYAGMRSVAVAPVDGVPRIVLNGVPLPQLSTLQQGFWPDGIYTPATDAAIVFDLARDRALGFNAVRKHQKVESDRFYYHADRLGLLVWQDMPATATGAQPPHLAVPPPPPPASGRVQFRTELRRLVLQHRNHPSIVMWIPFNEGWGAFDVAGIARWVGRLDPTRLVNEMSGADTAGYDAGGGDILDYHNIGIDPPAPVPPTSDGRAAVIGEFGAYGLVVPGHLWDPAETSSPAPVPDAATLEGDYARTLGAVAGYVARSGLSAANYNLFEDVEHQVNGLYTYDRRVLKADAGTVRAANAAVLAAGPGARSTPDPETRQ